MARKHLSDGICQTAILTIRRFLTSRRTLRIFLNLSNNNIKVATATLNMELVICAAIVNRVFFYGSEHRAVNGGLIICRQLCKRYTKYKGLLCQNSRNFRASNATRCSQLKFLRKEYCMFGKCKKHNCDYVIQEVRHFPGKTIEVCPECQKNNVAFLLSGTMPRQQGSLTDTIEQNINSLQQVK